MNPERPPLELHPAEDEILDLVYRLRAPDGKTLEHLRSCALCESRFQKTAADRERGRSRWHSELSVRRGSSRNRPRVFRWESRMVRAVGAMAALVAIGSVALLLRSPAESERLWLSDPGNELVLRSDDGEISRQLTAGIRAYMDQDLDTAVDLLSAPQPNAGRDLVRRLYLASALALQGDPAESIILLEGLELSRLPAPWRGEGRWTLAMAYLEAGEKEKARELLALMTKGSGVLAERARAFLEHW